MISVIISTYDRPERLKKAIDSVKAQTFKDWELIVAVDGDEKVRTPDYVNVIHIPHFGNDTKPKNEGIKLARGEYIAFLDDDNTFRPDHLQSLYNAIKDTDIDVVYGDRWINDETNTIQNQLGVFSEFSLSVLLQKNFIDTSDVLIKKESLYKVGGFDERYKKYIDWNLWVRMAKAGMKFKHVPLIITDYFLHDDMKSKKVQTKGDVVNGTFTPEWDPYDCEIRLPHLGKITPPKVAIYTLTYDRLALTKKMIESLGKSAGYPFDHYIVDNGSTDGTAEWLLDRANGGTLKHVEFNKTNQGISKASNEALERIKQHGPYDIIVKADNDVVFHTKGWLAKMVEIWESNHLLALSCYPQGLKDSPGGAMRIGYGRLRREMIGMTKHLGGACVFVDARAYDNFRWDTHDFLHAIQDVEFSRYILLNGWQMGYLEGYFMTHDTVKQQDDYKDYFERRKSEKTTRAK